MNTFGNTYTIYNTFKLLNKNQFLGKIHHFRLHWIHLGIHARGSKYIWLPSWHHQFAKYFWRKDWFWFWLAHLKNVSEIVNTAFLDVGDKIQFFYLLVSLSIPAGRMRLSYRSDPMIWSRISFSFSRKLMVRVRRRMARTLKIKWEEETVINYLLMAILKVLVIRKLSSKKI